MTVSLKLRRRQIDNQAIQVRGSIWALLIIHRVLIQPALVLFLAFVVIAVLVGEVTGEFMAPMKAACSGGIVTWLSVGFHEFGHLATLRLLTGDRDAGALLSHYGRICIVTTVQHPLIEAAVAVAGPLVGMLSAIALKFLIPAEFAWLCWIISLLHILNLLPCFPDGDVLFCAIKNLLSVNVSYMNENRSSEGKTDVFIRGSSRLSDDRVNVAQASEIDIPGPIVNVGMPPQDTVTSKNDGC